MKKLLILGSFFFGLTLASFSENRELFSINEDQILTEMNDLVQLENYLSTNMTSLSNLVSENNILVANISSNSASTMGISSFGEPALGIPSFLWGFCCWTGGVAIVYFVAEDKAETKKALWGCVAGTGLYAVVYIIYVVAVVNSVTSDPYYSDPYYYGY